MYIFELMQMYFRFGASAYVYWNLALFKGQSSTWGWKQNSLITVENGKAEFTPEFYLMKHFSHFVRRGAKYVRTVGEFSSNCVTFRNPDGGCVSIIANPYPFEVTVTLEGRSYLLEPRSVSTVTF